MPKNKHDGSFHLMKRLVLEYVKPEKSKLQFAMLCMLLASISTAVSAWILQPVLDQIFLEKNTTMLYLIPIAVIMNAIIKGVATFFQSSTMKRIGQKIITDIQLKLYSHLIYADLQYLNDYASGNLISRFTNDINAMRKSVSDVVTGLMMELVTLIGLIGVMFYQSFDLAIITMILIPVAFLPVLRLGRKMRKVAKGMQEELGGFTVRLDETFQNIGIVKSYCREEYEVSRARSIIDRFLDLYKRAAYIESASSPIMEVLGGIAVSAIIWYGGAQVINGTTTPGAFFSFITAILMSYKPLKMISSLNTSLQEGLAASRRLFSMLDEEPMIKDGKNVIEPNFETYNIVFNDVSFAYKNGVKTLDNISLNIPQGKTVALVGSSGSGKTTIFNLIQRLYDPNCGEITIDGKNIANVKLSSLRGSISVVNQEVALFDDSIRENIRYGNLDATDEQIMDAALAAAAHDFIINLPDGYDTQIGQQGVKLSGGQRQRIAIARAILKDAPILLMDEATSALDSISEKQVQMALEYLKRGRTTVVIAHRLSTIESADLIYVISDGKVVEAGSHDNLLDNHGEYAQFYEKYKDSKVA